MKEYLEKQADGSYKLVMRGIVGRDADIEVPEGATYYAIDSNLGIKKNYFFRCPNDAIWVDSQWMSASFSVAGQTVLWQRHTQPEELPFIDDGITDCREAIQEIYKPSDFGASSLNDQYAEIEQVRKQTIEATLAERQAQYGCFEDVARTTGKIMEALSEVRVNGLSDLPHPHRMALYMIASKMARIVNGDFNHKDSWHDIGGYSKLIEDLL